MGPNDVFLIKQAGEMKPTRRVYRGFSKAEVGRNHRLNVGVTKTATLCPQVRLRRWAADRPPKSVVTALAGATSIWLSAVVPLGQASAHSWGRDILGPPMTLTAGSKLGPYEIVSQLGSGGMGVVYQAHDPRLDRSAAIKLLPPDLTRDEIAKQRFLQEAKAASALDHPNICTIYDVGETDDGQLYLVMAHYEGETLKERISRGPLELNDAIDIASQVGEGLAEAHKAGIVHRDIKPANLFVTKTGVVKILDFGLAKLAGSEGVTQTGTTVGTVAYMSPEQAKGQEVDHRTDIWSLGVVLYEMLAGTPPFQGENLLSLADAIRSGEPEPVSGGGPSLNPTLGRAMSKDLGQRYQAVTDLLADLRTPQSGSDAATVATPAQADVPSIAVLPFVNMSADPEQEYFCDGLAEELIDALARLDGLRVVGRTSSFQFRGKGHDLRAIGEQLSLT